MIKSWLVFLSVLASSFAIPAYYGELNLRFTIIYILAILFIISLVTIITAPFSLKFSGELERDKILKNELTTYTLKVQNKGFLFYPIAEFNFNSRDFTDIRFKSRQLNIKPFSSSDQVYKIDIPYSGIYDVGVHNVVVRDYLGLFKVTIPVEDKTSLLVFPKSDEAFSVILRKDAESTPIDMRSFHESYEDVIDVRSYVPQDSLKKVHWKLSAKKNELLVKNYPSMASRTITLYVDGKLTDLQNPIQRLAVEDAIRSRVAAAVSFSTQTEQHAVLRYNSKSMEIKSEDDLNRAIEQVASIKFDSIYSDIIKFSSGLNEGVPPMIILFFTAYLDGDVFLNIERMKALDHTIFLYYFHHQPLSEQLKDMINKLKLIGVQLTTIEIELPFKADEGRGRR